MPDPARILYVDGNLDGTVGGSYFSLFYLVTGLDVRRFRPLVLFMKDHALVPDYRAAGIDTRIRPRPEVLSVKWRLPRLPARVMNAIQENLLWPLSLRRFLKAERIELVHLNNSTTGNHEWMLAARMAGIPCITHERGINRRFSRRTRLLAPRLAAVICISEAVRTNFALRGFDGLGLTTISNGLDPDRMRVTTPAAEIRRAFGVEGAGPLVGLVGNLKAWKGQETVIRAVALLRESFPAIGCLLIGGVATDQEPFAASMRALIAELKLEGRVVITGYRKDVADCIGALDVAVHASIDPEPFGRVLLEAMALRKPLVASSGGGVPEIVEDGVTGLIFRSGDSRDLAECVARLVRDPARAAAMGNAGYDRLVARFSIRQNVAQTEAVYDRILRRSA